MGECVIKISGLRKRYRLGVIGGGTLTADIQSWWAKKRGKEDPNLQIGESVHDKNEIFWALDGIDLEVNKGEALGVIGANGAGKSTLLKILSRVTAPTEGDIWLRGRVSSMLEVGTGFNRELTGRENIYLNGAILGMNKKEIDKKIGSIIEFSECKDFIDTPVKRYSSGMYVKLAFAVAAHLDADILIMDEVLAVGDMKFQKKCLGKMGKVSSEEGRTILYVSHNMNTIRQLCNRCIVLQHGKIIYNGDVDHAIEVYMEQQSGELESIYNFTDVKRPSTEHGNRFFVNRLEFLGKDVAIYKNTEIVQFKIDWTAYADLEELRFYFAIMYTDDTCVGMTQSKVFASVKKGQRGNVYLDFDISNLVEGKYYFYVDVFTMNEFFVHESYDHPMKKVFFEVVKDENIQSINWIRRAWGSVRLNELRIVEP